MNMSTVQKVFAGVSVGVVVLIILVLYSAVMSFPVMLLWNWLLPGLFGFKSITWLQAWGLLVLSNLFFKSSVSTSKKE